MKVSDYVHQEDAKVEASSNLISRTERRKKANADQESSLIEHVALATQIEIPKATLVKETARKYAQKVVNLAEVVQGLAFTESGEILKTAMEVKREKVACSKDGTSEASTSEAAAARGKSLSHVTSDSIIDLDSTTSSPSTNSNKLNPITIFQNSEKAI